jgi:DNA-binding transcriptional LysR family regulator
MALERDTLTAMAAFVAAVNAGSFSGAATKLGMTPSGVSKLVARLEERLNGRLFNRSTRRMKLTDLGALYFERARRILEDLDALETVMEERDDVPRGVLRVTAPVVLGHVRVLPVAVAFRKAFPEVRVDLLLVDRVVDLIEERIDLAIRMTATPPQASVAKKLGDDVRCLCASPDYFTRRGRPALPRDLTDHDCLAFYLGASTDGPTVPWILRSESGKPLAFRTQGPMQINNTLSLRDAALAGLGIADLPRYLVGADLDAGRLQTVLDEFIVVERAVYAVYAPGRPTPAKVREFVKVLADHFDERPHLGQTRRQSHRPIAPKRG